MQLNAVKGLLTRADVLAAEPLAAGFPLWLPYGTALVERFEALYRDELAQRHAFEEFEPPLLVDAAPYAAAISESLAYQNMYRLDGRHGPCLLRPDNLVAAGAALAGRGAAPPLLMQGSLFRAETGKLRPLVRDKHIWSATQVVHHVPARATAAALALHRDAFSAFLARIGVPSLHLETGALRDHSTRGLLTVAVPGEQEITLTSTLYELAPALVRRLGLTGGVVELGFTTKLLAAAAALHADAHGLMLTGALAPTQVLVGWRSAEERALADRLAPALPGRVAVGDEPWSRALARSRRRGVPLAVLAAAGGEHRLIRRRDAGSRPLGPDPVQAVRAELAAHDRALHERALATLEGALAREQAVKRGRAAGAPDGWHVLGRLEGVGEPGRECAREEVVLCRKRRLY